MRKMRGGGEQKQRNKQASNTKAKAVYRIFWNILVLNVQQPQEVEESGLEGRSHPRVWNYPFKIHIYQESQ